MLLCGDAMNHQSTVLPHAQTFLSLACSHARLPWIMSNKLLTLSGALWMLRASPTCPSCLTQQSMPALSTVLSETLLPLPQPQVNHPSEYSEAISCPVELILLVKAIACMLSIKGSVAHGRGALQEAMDGLSPRTRRRTSRTLQTTGKP